MARGNATSRSKSTHPFPGAGIRTASTESSQKTAAAESYEYQQLKRFAQALNNPDWRNRRSHNSSSTSSRGESIASGKRWARRDYSSTDMSCDDCQCEDRLGQAIVSQNPSQGANHGIAINENAAPLTSGKTGNYTVEHAVDKGFYQVSRQVNINGLQDGNDSLTVFEVIPLSSSQTILGSNRSPNIVEIKPLIKQPRTMRTKQENSQTEQLTAALEAADITPRKVRSSLISTSQIEEVFNCYAHHNDYQVKNEGPAATITTFSESKRKDRSSREEQTSIYPTPIPIPFQTSGEQQREAKQDVAFQRMLQKLTRNRVQDPNTTVKGRRDDGGEAIPVAHAMREKPVPISTLRYPVQSIDRRMATTSDFTVNYVSGSNNSHRKEDTNSSVDSGVYLEEQIKFKTLNPRAREFLSFVNCQDSNLQETTNPPHPFALESLADNGGHNTGLIDEPSLTITAPIELPASKYEQILTTAGNPLGFGNDNISPLAIQNVLAGNVIPLAGQFQGQLSAAPGIALPPPPGLGLQPVLQPIGGNLLGISPTPLVNAVLPVAGPINPGLVAPSYPLPLPFVGAVPRPPPVPKPRRPDPGDQQAYEAWIEWRKANEPGYALECKLRQQRRAQRNGTDRLKFQKKSEVVTAA